MHSSLITGLQPPKYESIQSKEDDADLRAALGLPRRLRPSEHKLDGTELAWIEVDGGAAGPVRTPRQTQEDFCPSPGRETRKSVTFGDGVHEGEGEGSSPPSGKDGGGATKKGGLKGNKAEQGGDTKTTPASSSRKKKRKREEDAGVGQDHDMTPAGSDKNSPLIPPTLSLEGFHKAEAALAEVKFVDGDLVEEEEDERGLCKGVRCMLIFQRAPPKNESENENDRGMSLAEAIATADKMQARAAQGITNFVEEAASFFDVDKASETVAAMNKAAQEKQKLFLEKNSSSGAAGGGDKAAPSTSGFMPNFDNDKLMVGTQEGTILVFDLVTLDHELTVLNRFEMSPTARRSTSTSQSGGEKAAAVTGLDQTDNIVTAAYADGIVRLFEFPTMVKVGEFALPPDPKWVRTFEITDWHAAKTAATSDDSAARGPAPYVPCWVILSVSHRDSFDGIVDGGSGADPVFEPWLLPAVLNSTGGTAASSPDVPSKSELGAKRFSRIGTTATSTSTGLVASGASSGAAAGATGATGTGQTTAGMSPNDSFGAASPTEGSTIASPLESPAMSSPEQTHSTTTSLPSLVLGSVGTTGSGGQQREQMGTTTGAAHLQDAETYFSVHFAKRAMGSNRIDSISLHNQFVWKESSACALVKTGNLLTSSLFLPHQKLPRKRFRKNFGKILTISARFSGHPKRQILGRSGFSYRGQKVWQNFGKCARAQFLCGKKIQPRTVSVGFAGAAAAPQGGRGGMPIAALPSKIAAPDTRASGGSIPRVCSPRRACSVTTATGGGREEL